MERMTMTHAIAAALASSARREGAMLRRDFLKTATATAVLTATLPNQAKETQAMSNANFADVNGQHIFYSVSRCCGIRIGERSVEAVGEIVGRSFRCHVR